MPAGSEPVRPENSEVPGGARDPEVSGGARDPEVPGGAHDPMRDDVDGDEAMVPRVPNLPVSSLRCVEGSSTRTHSSREEGEFPEIGIDCGFFGRDKEDVLPILCVKCRNSSTGCVGATVVDRKGASDYASSFLTAFMKSLGMNDHC